MSGPRKAPVLGLKAIILLIPGESEKLPTSNALPKTPKEAGAIVIPHGELSGPFETRRWTKTPLVVNLLT